MLNITKFITLQKMIAVQNVSFLGARHTGDESAFDALCYLTSCYIYTIHVSVFSASQVDLDISKLLRLGQLAPQRQHLYRTLRNRIWGDHSKHLDNTI